MVIPFIALARDIRGRYQRMVKAGFDVGTTTLTMQLECIKSYRNKIIHGDVRMCDIDFDQFMKKILAIMESAELFL